MPNAIFLAPAGSQVGLTSVGLGLVRMLDCLRVRVGYFKPIEQLHDWDDSPDKSLDLIRQTSDLDPPDFIPAEHARQLISQGNDQDLLEQVVELYKQISNDFDIVIVEGLHTNKKVPFSARLNIEIARTIDAEVIFVASMQGLDFTGLNTLLEISAKIYGGIHHPKVLGCIVNHANAPQKNNQHTHKNHTYPHLQQTITKTSLQSKCEVFKDGSFKLLGMIHWNAILSAFRTCDVVEFLGANYLHPGDIRERRVLAVVVGVSTLANMCNQLKPGTLLLVSGDRENIVVTACMAALNGIPLAGIILTDGLLPRAEVLQFCERAMLTGLPIVTTQASLYQTALSLENMNNEIPVDDTERIEATVSYLADCLEVEWLQEHCAISREAYFSPAAFRYSLIQSSKQVQKTIVLPEGEEPRIMQAAVICHEKKIAKCILIGAEEKIYQNADAIGLTLPSDMKIISPDDVKANYIEPFIEMRKHKGVTVEMAEQSLDDHIILGTMMVALDEVDGLVAGAITTTANTVRPALRLLKTKQGAKLVSSVFFMCLPEQVVVYGDCAVNPNPNPEELADIAIQSADSAKAFGITPRVAMISYSTGSSGAGGDVEKVTQATKLAQERRPDLLIDGPLQYDAAAIESVGLKKAPGSKVAGKATVFVFPDLNTGNTTYKAVQRSANVVSIGPMLQGLRKPVNDLSRGALVDDIVYTIALTCIQANSI